MIKKTKKMSIKLFPKIAISKDINIEIIEGLVIKKSQEVEPIPNGHDLPMSVIKMMDMTNLKKNIDHHVYICKSDPIYLDELRYYVDSYNAIVDYLNELRCEYGVLQCDNFDEVQ